MKRYSGFMSVLLVSVGFLVLVTLIVSPSEAATHTLDMDTDIEALEASLSDGDTLVIEPGYYEGLTIRHSIEIVGSSPEDVFFDGLVIQADNVTVSDLNLLTSGGLLIVDSANVTMDNFDYWNKGYENESGLWVLNSTITARDCTFRGFRKSILVLDSQSRAEIIACILTSEGRSTIELLGGSYLRCV